MIVGLAIIMTTDYKIKKDLTSQRDSLTTELKQAKNKLLQKNIIYDSLQRFHNENCLGLKPPPRAKSRDAVPSFD